MKKKETLGWMEQRKMLKSQCKFGKSAAHQKHFIYLISAGPNVSLSSLHVSHSFFFSSS